MSRLEQKIQICWIKCFWLLSFENIYKLFHHILYNFPAEQFHMFWHSAQLLTVTNEVNEDSQDQRDQSIKFIGSLLDIWTNANWNSCIFLSIPPVPIFGLYIFVHLFACVCWFNSIPSGHYFDKDKYISPILVAYIFGIIYALIWEP